MEERLRIIFENVNSWLRFAEAKNGALFAANLALVCGNLRIVCDISKSHQYLFSYLWVVTGVLLISAVICLTSFVPQLKMPWFFKNPTSDLDNLLFFGHLAKYQPYVLLEKLEKTFEIQSKKSQIELNYAEQIIVNSKIAVIKYAYFKFAIWLSISAIATPLIAIIFWFINNKIHEEQR